MLHTRAARKGGFNRTRVGVEIVSIHTTDHRPKNLNTAAIRYSVTVRPIRSILHPGLGCLYSRPLPDPEQLQGVVRQKRLETAPL